MSYLVGKADTSTKADTTNDEHGQVLGKGTQDGTNAEGSATTDHDQLPAAKSGYWVGEESEEGACKTSEQSEDGRARLQSKLWQSANTQAHAAHPVVAATGEQLQGCKADSTRMLAGSEACKVAGKIG